MADSQRKTANLLNSDQSAQGDGYVDNALLKDGNIIQNTNAFFVTEYMPVTEGTYYYYNNLFRTTVGYINYYNSNKIHLGNVQQKSVMTQDTYNLTALTIPSGVSYIRMSIDKQSTENGLYTSQLPAYEPYGWVHSLRKLTTATEAIENPLYSDSTAITAYTIKGNTTQSGTPSPSNPVAVVGVGELTDNIFNVNDSSSMSTAGCTATVSDNTLSQVNIGAYSRTVWEFNNIVPNDKYTVTVNYNNPNNCSVQIRAMDSDNSTIIAATAAETNISGTLTLTFTARNTKQYIRLYSNTLNEANNATVTFAQIMLVSGDTAPTSYIPYGYKIPILTAQGSAVNYLANVQSTRQIKKLVLTGGQDEQWSMSDSTFGKRFSMTISGAKQSDTSTVATICSHLPLGVAGATYSITNTYTITAASVLYISRDDTYTSVADFKAWLAAEYANGTPVTLWYAFAPTETGIVNEPLMKIGDYLDSISNATAIPTTEGANSITVDTTVQPSEFTATWTGWHDSSVKEYDGSDWQ